VRRARIAAVIPAYNVSAQIERVLAGAPARLDHLVVVDDASTDDTAARVAASPDPRVVLLRRATNGGVGAAVKEGYRHALALRADVVVKMDGDDQMDPARLGALIAPLVRDGADYAKGNRFRTRDALRPMPWVRRLGNLGLSFLTKAASGYWNLFDPTNGYTAIRREALLELDLERVADRYFFEISMLVELNLTGAVVRDVFMPARYADERSSLSIPRTLLGFPPRLALATLRRLWIRHFLQDFTPVSLFLVGAAPLVTAGAYLGSSYWLRSIATGIPTTAGQVMLAVLPLLAGIQLLLQAVMLDIASVPRQSALEAAPLDAAVVDELSPPPS
jgi:glycosyltransferase involved in cell wall biosynthesis